MFERVRMMRGWRGGMGEIGGGGGVGGIGGGAWGGWEENGKDVDVASPCANPQKVLQAQHAGDSVDVQVVFLLSG